MMLLEHNGGIYHPPKSRFFLQDTEIPRFLRDVRGYFQQHQPLDLGLSENNVPLHPMVNDHYPY